MHLFIARHSIAEQYNLNGDDRLRVLTKEGVDRAHTLARELKQHNLVPDLIFCSPLIRASHTASIVAQSLGLAAPKTIDELAPENDLFLSLEDLLPVETNKAIMLVSHNPMVGYLVECLLEAAVDRHSLRFAPASVAILELSSWKKRGAKLVQYIDGSSLKH